MKKYNNVTITMPFATAPETICDHAYTMEVNGVAFSVRNVFDFGEYDPEIRDRVMFELRELLTKSGNWVFSLSKEDLFITIKAEVAVNRAARKGLYKHNPGFFGEWLETKMDNAVTIWEKDEETYMIARVLLAICGETFGQERKFHTRIYSNWRIAKEYHAEKLFEKKAAELFAVA